MFKFYDQNVRLHGWGSSCPHGHCVGVEGGRGGVQDVRKCVGAGAGVGGGVERRVKLPVGAYACAFALHHPLHLKRAIRDT